MWNGYLQSVSKWEEDPLDSCLIKTSKILCNLSYVANRVHVAVRLFSNRSQKMSKYGKNISDTLGYIALCASFFVHTTFCRHM